MGYNRDPREGLPSTEWPQFAFSEHISATVGVLCGKPCLIGRRFSVAQLLVELANGRLVDDVADDYLLDREHVRGALLDLSLLMGR